MRAPPDGYTLLGATGANAINATLYENLTFNFISDIAPVASIVRAALVMTVNLSVPAETVPQFIAYAKQDQYGFGRDRQYASRCRRAVQCDRRRRFGSRPLSRQSRPDLLAGQVQLVFAPIPTVIGYVKAGKPRALAVTSTTRVLALPDTPTMTEFVPGYEASTWFGIGAPKGVPAEIVVKLNKEANAGLADPKMIEHLTDLGSDPMPMTPDEFGKFIADETAKWAKVIRTSNIKPE